MEMALARTFIVTGGNTGLGLECAYALRKDSSVLVIIRYNVLPMTPVAHFAFN
jgi:NAD(P)-dependent dehydrogenase (short-subunit alcohol dehydrogenase family)